MKPAWSVRAVLSLASAALAVALLASCGPVLRVNPPGASIQKLSLRPDGTLMLDLRLQNFSDIATRFGRFDGGIFLAGVDAGPLNVAIDLEVPAHAADVFQTVFTPEAGAREAVAAAFGSRKGSGAGITYRLSGRIDITEPGGNFESEYESALSPVPGIPGEYR